MRQLVGNQALPDRSVRRILASAKGDLVAHGVGQGAHGLGRLGGLPARMYAHARKVVAEARLHHGAGCRIQWLAGCAQHVMHDRWGYGRRRGLASALQPLLSTCSALADAGCGVLAAGAFALEQGWRGGVAGAGACCLSLRHYETYRSGSVALSICSMR
jgi:hypothetical protein